MGRAICLFNYDYKKKGGGGERRKKSSPIIIHYVCGYKCC